MQIHGGGHYYRRQNTDDDEAQNSLLHGASAKNETQVDARDRGCALMKVANRCLVNIGDFPATQISFGVRIGMRC
tara:strand:- start:550 stop:774 length:225 start_codon:yes stop_codon:yes gene_type:complete